MSRYLGLGEGSDSTVNLSSYTQIVASCSGSSGSTSLTATNASFSAGQRIFIHQSRGTGAGAYEDNKILSYVAGTITLVHPLENDYTDSGASQAQVVVVPQATDVTGSFTVDAWDGDTGGLFVIACTGTFSGTINANEKGFRGGNNGRSNGINSIGQQGENQTGSQSYAKASAGVGGGGGGVRTNEGGGVGGAGACANSTSDSETTKRFSPGAPGGDGATAFGDDSLSTLLFGGGGGGGGVGDSLGTNGLGVGGNGGGIVVVYANKIDSSASITCLGEQAGSFDQDQGPGGPGASGMILIRSKTVTIGTDKIQSGQVERTTLSEGAGFFTYSDYGSEGRIRIESCSITGTTSPTASESEGGHAWCGSLTFIM